MEVSEPIDPKPDRRLIYEPPSQPPSCGPLINRETNNIPRNKTFNPPSYGVTNWGRYSPSSRGRGHPHRGWGQHGDSGNFHHTYHLGGPSRTWRDDKSGQSRGGYAYATPVHTQIRYAPFCDEGPYDSHSHSNRDKEKHSRPPNNYNYNYPGQSQPQGFHKPTPRSPRLNEVLEGGGTFSAKRKRVQ